MKGLKYIFAMLLISGMTISCSNDDDSYSLNNFSGDFGTINYLDFEGNSYDIILDNGKKLWIAAPLNLPKPEYKRAFFNYTLLSDSMSGYDHYVRLNYMIPMTTKDIIYMSTADEDSIGNDPVKLVSLWEAGGYMNFHIEYNSGGAKKHMVNLISREKDLSVSKDTVVLEFRHNKNNDPEYSRVYSFASFDLAPYKREKTDSICFKIKVNEFGGEKTYLRKYKYKYPANVR